ncbi:MAG: hypothetical protein ACTS6G_05910 [Candidatus Hodgkinia cicadicola]
MGGINFQLQCLSNFRSPTSLLIIKLLHNRNIILSLEVSLRSRSKFLRLTSWTW